MVVTLFTVVENYLASGLSQEASLRKALVSGTQSMGKTTSKRDREIGGNNGFPRSPARLFKIVASTLQESLSASRAFLATAPVAAAPPAATVIALVKYFA